MLCVLASASDNVMKLMREYACQGTAEQQFTGICRSEGAANPVAFDISERKNLAVGSMSVCERYRSVGSLRKVSSKLAAAAEFHDHESWKGIGRSQLVYTPPAQFHSGISHEGLEFLLHFEDRSLRVRRLKLENEGHFYGCEGGARGCN
jgi:hypothetical protein